MNKSIHDKIAHQQLRIPLLIVENITGYTREHSGKEHRFGRSGGGATQRFCCFCIKRGNLEGMRAFSLEKLVNHLL